MRITSLLMPLLLGRMLGVTEAPRTRADLLLIAVPLILICPPLCAGETQENTLVHPVLDHGISPARAEAYEKAVGHVMAMSEAEMLSFVPDKPFVRFCYCPNCHGGSQGSSIYGWSVEQPEELKCKYCGMVFPNDKYPADQLLKGKNPLGETVAYQYHQGQTRSDLQIFFEGHILMYKRQWILGQLRALATAYHATQKPEYACRAVLILDRIAQVYPHYPVMRQWITTFRFGPQKPPYPGAGGRWGRWVASELPSGVIESYDLVYDSSEFDKLSEERGYSVREKVENDFFIATFEYVNTFAKHSDNMAPSYLRTAIQMGRVLNKPRQVHWAYGWLLEILHGGCFYDGCWKEAPSYHYQVMGGLQRGFDSLRGHTDPPGYVDPVDGKRFDNLDPDKDITFMAKARRAFSAVDFPNGKSSTIHDTWPNERRSSPRDRTVSRILPGYGHASLGFGQLENQIQAQLHFSGGYGHQHRDNLGLSLFAKGREMVCDIGYTHTKLRNWSTSTVGHNTVVIDRKNQSSSASDGDLLAFYPNVNGVSMVEADGKRAYREIEGIQTYRRMLLLVPVSADNAYVVDLFSTVGGQIHDWILHGDADHDMKANCSMELATYRENMLEDGETWQEPNTEQSSFNPYGAIREIHSGQTNDKLSFAFAYTDKPDTGVHLHVLGGVDTQVFLGQSPSIRRAGRDSQKAWDFWTPQLVLRRTATGQGPLRSLFAVVMEPFSGQPSIDSVERLALNPTQDGVVALQVRYGDTVDTIIKTDDKLPYPERVTATGIRLKGRLGIVRQRAGGGVRLWLFDGESLQANDAHLDIPAARYEGQILTATRKVDDAENNAFITDAELPAGDALHGAWMIVTHGNGFTHGYPIDRVERRDDKTSIVLGIDHGLRIDGAKTQEVYFPRRNIAGVNRFMIPLSATLASPAN